MRYCGQMSKILHFPFLTFASHSLACHAFLACVIFLCCMNAATRLVVSVISMLCVMLAVFGVA